MLIVLYLNMVIEQRSCYQILKWWGFNMNKCNTCNYTPCTVAQGCNCCIECMFRCNSMCQKAFNILSERENKMKVGTKKEAQKNEIKVTRAHQFDDGSVTFDMTVNGVTIYGNRIVEGSKGTFVSFPSRKGT